MAYQDTKRIRETKAPPAIETSIECTNCNVRKELSQFEKARRQCRECRVAYRATVQTAEMRCACVMRYKLKMQQRRLNIGVNHATEASG